MLNATVHVLLVSAQAAPNLLPTLDPEIKPKEAILLVSRKMRPRAGALEVVLREAGVRTARVELENEHDFEYIENAMYQLAAERATDRIALNVTGGTKLMALAAQSVAVQAGWEVFYVDVDTDEVIPLEKHKPRRKLTSTLRLPHYLRAYGYRLEVGSRRPQLRPRCLDLLQTLVTQVGSLERALGELNRLAQTAEDDNQLHAAISDEQLDSRSFDALLRDFEQAGVLSVDGNVLHFAGEADRSFAKGGWLEHYVFRTVGALSASLDIRDKDTNLEVVDESGVKNELDIAFMARNRLFVIECKTARMDGPRAPKANDTLFKLAEVCRRVGGLGTRGMLASYRPLGKAERRLARALNIEVACGGDLMRLDERLKRWVMA